MTLALYEEISSERDRQDEKHPKLPNFFLHPTIDPHPEQIQRSLKYQREENDALESTGNHSWFGIDREELYEKYANVDRYGCTRESLLKIREEAVQAAALHVRQIEYIDTLLTDKDFKITERSLQF